MRKAAGIILIILVVFGLVTLIIDVRDLSGSGIPSLGSILWAFVYRQIIYGGFLVAAGVLCLKRKYWGLCLAPPLFAFLTGIYSVVQPLLREPPSIFFISMTWGSWILVVGALVSTIFISLRKKEWLESQA